MTYMDATLRGLLVGEESPYPFSAVPEEEPEYDLAERVPLPDGGVVTLGADVPKGRTLTFESRIRSDTRAEHVAAEDALKAAWAPSAVDLEMLVTWDGDPRLIYGRPVDCAIKSDRTRVANHLSWARYVFRTTTDPLWYGQTEKTAFVTMPSGSSGVLVETGGVLVETTGVTVVGGATAGNASALNAGTADVHWRARIVGPVVNPRVAVNQAIVIVQGTVEAGSVAVIDSRTKTMVLDNGLVSWIDPILSRWAKLPAGIPTTFALRGDSGTGTAELRWRDGKH